MYEYFFFFSIHTPRSQKYIGIAKGSRRRVVRYVLSAESHELGFSILIISLYYFACNLKTRTKKCKCIMFGLFIHDTMHCWSAQFLIHIRKALLRFKDDMWQILKRKAKNLKFYNFNDFISNDTTTVKAIEKTYMYFLSMVKADIYWVTAKNKFIKKQLGHKKNIL